MNKKWSDDTRREQNLLLYGAEEQGGKRVVKQVEGVYNMMSRLLLKRDGSEMGEASMRRLTKFIHQAECPLCQGKRLNATTLSCKVAGYSIDEMCEMEFTELRIVLQTIHDSRSYSVADSLVTSLNRMIDIGLPYLFFNR